MHMMRKTSKDEVEIKKIFPQDMENVLALARAAVQWPVVTWIKPSSFTEIPFSFHCGFSRINMEYRFYK